MALFAMAYHEMKQQQSLQFVTCRSKVPWAMHLKLLGTECNRNQEQE